MNWWKRNAPWLAGALLALLAALITFLPRENRPAQVTVRFQSPVGEEALTLDRGQSAQTPPGPEIDGYTFLGWEDAWGNRERRESLRVYEDAEYYAVYAMALGGGEHIPYLELSEEGLFRPGDPLTRREAAIIVYRLLGTDLVGDGAFLDVDRKDACYSAVATLKQLGALEGSRFHPDETITRSEMLELLCAFFPEGSGTALFADLKDGDPGYPAFRTAAERGWIESGKGVEARPLEDLTRREAAVILNRALGRSGDRERRAELVGTILDVSRTDPDFWDIAEACIPHGCSRDGAEERWESSEALPLREEGLFFVGVRLHAIDAEGDPVTSRDYAGLSFNAAGEETSGLPELDKLIWETLEQLVDPETQSREEMLRTVYDYTVRHFRYRGRDHHPVGETGWEAQDAYTIFSTRYGNCYGFAAAFGEMARAIGVEARIQSGTIRGDMSLAVDHSWVEIQVDGKWRVFDPEMEYRGWSEKSFYCLSETTQMLYGYSVEPPPTPEPAPEESPAPSPKPEASPKP